MHEKIKKLIDSSDNNTLAAAVIKATRIKELEARVELCLKYKVCPNCAAEGLDVIHESLDEEDIDYNVTYICDTCKWKITRRGY